MSKQEVLKFIDKVNQDERLFEKIGKLPSSRVQAVVALAHAEGFDFSVDEFISTVLSQNGPNGELADEELGKVAGGTVSIDPMVINFFRFVSGQD
jgi:predicted ribosomally synthesized peptide with nif11-like leader